MKNRRVGTLRSDSMSFAIIDISRHKVIRYRLRTKDSQEAFAMQSPTSVNFSRELILQMGYQADDADPSQPCKPAASIMKASGLRVDGRSAQARGASDAAAHPAGKKNAQALHASQFVTSQT